jgi:hypothetical protein
MKRISRLLLFGALILVLLTAACGAEEGTPITSYPGPSTPGGDDLDLTGTPFDGIETTETAETATEEAGTPTVDATDSAAMQVTATGSPAVDTTQTPGIPVTGADVILVECQFCVDTRAHALLVLPDTATFEIVSPAPAITTSTTAVDTESRCSTVEVNNGRQVVLCSGPEMSPLVVNICTTANTCTDFPVDLLACPLTQQGGTAVPDQTQTTPAVDGTEPTSTSTPSIVISTATP